jgi:hypothetical protein
VSLKKKRGIANKIQQGKCKDGTHKHIVFKVEVYLNNN